MGSKTGIEWTKSTWNPTTGCDRVSPGCDNCYALRQAGRLKLMGSLRYQNDGDPVSSGPGFKLTIHDDVRKLSEPLRWQKPRLIFVDSMSDLFHKDVPLEFIQKVFQVCADAPRHTFQILTKRHQRMAILADDLEWHPNIWMGVSVESSRYRYRVDYLRRVPAAVRFISAEPLLGPIPDLDLGDIDWMIVGGESGPGFRPMQEEWATDLRDQCRGADVPFFFKQWGGRTSKAGGSELVGAHYKEMPRSTPPGLTAGLVQ